MFDHEGSRAAGHRRWFRCSRDWPEKLSARGRTLAPRGRLQRLRRRREGRHSPLIELDECADARLDEKSVRADGRPSVNTELTKTADELKQIRRGGSSRQAPRTSRDERTGTFISHLIESAARAGARGRVPEIAIFVVLLSGPAPGDLRRPSPCR